MRPISVLFTNNSLGPRAGSEVYVRDVALALQRRGHRPMAFSLVLGDVAAELRAATIPVVDDVSRIGEAPDVIHGHHHVETLIAALAFPNTPIVNFCHGWVPWEEMPLVHPSVRRYVAVDEVCVDRLVREEGIAREQIDLLLNFVDLERFGSRAPLPVRPARALVLSNSATTDGYARVIAAACESAGIALDIVGAGAGNASDAPERLLQQYELVFAKGKTALEALAVGCSTVLADWAGAGPIVTPDNYERLRVRNFGIRELQQPHDVAWYRQQIAQYDGRATSAVSARVRADAGMEPAIDRLIAIYTTAMSLPIGSGNPASAAAHHVSRVATSIKGAHDVARRLHKAEAELAQVRAARDSAVGEVRQVSASIGALETALRSSEATARDLERSNRALEQQAIERDRDLTDARGQVRALEQQAVEQQSVATLRLRNAVLKVPLVGPAMHAGARWLAQMFAPQPGERS